MAKESTQISAPISDATRDRLERYVRRTGVKKGHFLEEALLHHLQALESIPAEFVVHPRVVVSRKTGEEMLRDAQKATPNAALRKLLRDGD
jgi:hypothetical protein